MPKVWEQRAEAIKGSLEGKIKDPERLRRIAYATATKQLQNEGVLKEGTRELKK